MDIAQQPQQAMSCAVDVLVAVQPCQVHHLAATVHTEFYQYIALVRAHCRRQGPQAIHVRAAVQVLQTGGAPLLGIVPPGKFREGELVGLDGVVALAVPLRPVAQGDEGLDRRCCRDPGAALDLVYMARITSCPVRSFPRDRRKTGLRPIHRVAKLPPGLIFGPVFAGSGTGYATCR